MKRIKCHVKRFGNEWILKRAGEILTEKYKSFKDAGDAVFMVDVNEAIDDAAQEAKILEAHNLIRRSKYGYYEHETFVRNSLYHSSGKYEF